MNSSKPYIPNYKSAAWLEKWGWERGKGLGKSEDGIKECLYVPVKQDTLGLGATQDAWDKWWEKVYNTAAENSKKKARKARKEEKKKKKDKQPLLYGAFVKTSNDDSSSEEEQSKETKEDNLLTACGGIMFSQTSSANQSGKLKRLKEQEAKFARALKEQEVNSPKEEHKKRKLEDDSTTISKSTKRSKSKKS